MNALRTNTSIPLSYVTAEELNAAGMKTRFHFYSADINVLLTNTGVGLRYTAVWESCSSVR